MKLRLVICVLFFSVFNIANTFAGPKYLPGYPKINDTIGSHVDNYIEYKIWSKDTIKTFKLLVKMPDSVVFNRTMEIESTSESFRMNFSIEYSTNTVIFTPTPHYLLPANDTMYLKIGITANICNNTPINILSSIYTDYTLLTDTALTTFVKQTKPEIRGEISVSDTSLEYDRSYNIHAKFIEGAVDINNSEINMRIPAGQQYNPGTAKVFIDDIQITWSDQELVDRFSKEDSINTERSITLKFPKEIPSGKTLNFTATFTPKCATPLTGIHFSSTFSGTNGCDIIAEGSDIVYKTEEMLSRMYTISTSIASGKKAFNEINKEDKLKISIQKNKNILLPNSTHLYIYFPKNIKLSNITTDEEGGEIDSYTETIEGETNKIVFRMPVAKYNEAVTSGNSYNINYIADIEYIADKNDDYLVNNPERVIKVVAKTEDGALSNACNIKSEMIIDEKEIKIALVTASENPYQGKLYEATTMQILNPSFAGEWFSTETGGTALSSINEYVCTPNIADTLKFYVSAVFNGVDYGRVPIVLNVPRVKLSLNGFSIANKTYDGTTLGTINNTGALQGMLNFDDVNINTTSANIVFTDANAGNVKNVTVSGLSLTGIKAANYTLVQPSGLVANINKATLNITAHEVTMAYGTNPESLNLDNAYDILGFVNNESIAVLKSQATVSLSGNIADTSSVGEYPDAVLISSATADNYEITHINNKLTITKADLTLSLNNGTAVYTGNPLTISPANLTGVIGNVNMPITYTYKKGTETISQAINAGTYTVIASVPGDANHNATTATAQFTITKANLTLTLNDDTAVYTGSPLTIAPANLTGVLGGASIPITYTYKNGTETISQAINAGTYTVIASVPGDANHAETTDTATFTVTKAGLTLSLNNGTAVYTGSPLTIAPANLTGVIGNVNMPITYTYKKGTETSNQAINAGTYTVIAKTLGDANHAEATDTAQFTVTKAGLTLSLNNGTAVYTGSPLTIAPANLTGVIGNVNMPITYTYKKGTETSNQAINAGTYTVIAKTLGDANHAEATDTAQFTVTKAGLTLSLNNGTAVYTGSPLTIAPANLTGVIGNVNMPITYTYKNGTETISQAINAGTYTVIAKTLGDVNHAEATDTAQFTVTKAGLTLSLNNGTAVYTGNPLTIAPANLTGVLGGASMPITYTYKKGTETISQVLNVGTYTVIAKVTGNANHNGTADTAQFTITKANPVITLTSVTSEYTGNPISINTPVVTGSSTVNTLALIIKYKGIGTTNYPETNEAPTEYGTYQANVSTLGDTNHNPASSTASISIGKKVPVMSLIGNNKIYDGTPLALTATIAPSTLNIIYKYTGTQKDGTPYNSATAPINAGDYKVTASTQGNNNYSATSVSANIEISKKAANISISNKSTPYTGEPIAIDKPVTEPTDAVLVITYTKQTVRKKLAKANNETPPTEGGSYLVTAKFAGTNNYKEAEATANLTITATGAPTLSLDNKTVTYNGNQHSIGVATITPATAQYLTVDYVYTNASYPESSTAPINAGVYTVKASTKKDANFEAGSVNATLTIERATQTITFPEFEPKKLGDADFKSKISINTGLALTYTSGNVEIAEISTNGTITIRKAGTVTITATQEGNNNYLPTSVSRTLNITSSNALLESIVVNGNLIEVKEQMFFSLECNNITEFDVNLLAETNAKISVEGYEFVNGKFHVISEKPMVKIIKITVTSQDGSNSKIYELQLQKNFEFDHIVRTRWNNTLSVYNNPANNFGYTFTGTYKWYKNDNLIYEGEYYSVGEKATDKLNPNDLYYVEMTTTDGQTLRTCTKQAKLKNSNITIYPNPVSAGEIVYIKTNNPEMLIDATLEIYNMSGLIISKNKVTEHITAPNYSGIYIFKLQSKNGLDKSFKIIVK